jgi:hypothetical protein
MWAVRQLGGKAHYAGLAEDGEARLTNTLTTSFRRVAFWETLAELFPPLAPIAARGIWKQMAHIQQLARKREGSERKAEAAAKVKAELPQTRRNRAWMLSYEAACLRYGERRVTDMGNHAFDAISKDSSLMEQLKASPDPFAWMAATFGI